MKAAGQDLASLFFGFDARIRYVSILDSLGRTVEGGMRPGLSSLEPKDEADRVDIQVALIRGMTEAAGAYLGATNYVIVHREKIMLMALPWKDRKTVLITTEPDFPLERVPALIEMVSSSG